MNDDIRKSLHELLDRIVDFNASHSRYELVAEFSDKYVSIDNKEDLYDDFFADANFNRGTGDTEIRALINDIDDYEREIRNA